MKIDTLNKTKACLLFTCVLQAHLPEGKSGMFVVVLLLGLNPLYMALFQEGLKRDAHENVDNRCL